MQFFSSEGKPIRITKKTRPESIFYYDNGDLRQVPNIFDSKQKILPFLYACMKNKFPEITEEDVLEMWDFMEEKKKLILTYLNALKEQREIEGENYRAIAYAKAIKIIDRVDFPIASGEQAMELPGIGKSIGGKIDEILTTGKLSIVDERIEEFVERQKIIEKFMEVWGIGVKKAKMLYEQGYRTLEELEEAPLNEQERIGLKYRTDFLQRIPRSEIAALEPKLHQIFDNVKIITSFTLKNKTYTFLDIDEKYTTQETVKGSSILPYLRMFFNLGTLTMMIKNKDITYNYVHLKDVDKDARFCICGSYRRKAKHSGDIDILISSSILDKSLLLQLYVRDLFLEKILIESLALGKTKFMGVADTGSGIARRIDIRALPLESWGTGVLYFTGSDSFNEMMRAEIKKKGFTLSEYSLKNLEIGEIIPTKTEKDVFDFLDMKYVPPQERK